jgi:hypothetical protein
MRTRPIPHALRVRCAVLCTSLAGFAVAAAAQEPPKAAVLSAPQSPYLPVAREIAQIEKLPLRDSLESVLANPPSYLLWVAAPGELSDRLLADSLQGLEKSRAPVVVGLITGSSAEQALALWQRAQAKRGDRSLGIRGEHPEAGVPQARMGAPGEPLQPANTALVRDALGKTDYLHYAGHGSNAYWDFGTPGGLRPGDIPDLGPMVVSTESCQTARPWEANNIALRFVDQGAAAYAGFAFSPFSGYTLGALEDLPFQFTWPDFPIGRVVALQNAAAARVYARVPIQLLLGDPRIALRTSAPYTIARDAVGGAQRQLSFQDAPAGLLPLRVPGGARYIYIAVPGTAETPVHGGSYNSRLQAVAAGNDLYVLLRHAGGPFELMLWERAPFVPAWKARFCNVLDHSLIYLPGTVAGIVLSLVVGFANWMLAWRRHRQGWLDQRMIIGGVAAGVAIALMHAAYQWARVEDATIVSKPLDFNAFACAGAFLVASGACCCWLSADTWREHVSALFLAVAPLLAVTAFVALVLGGWNLNLGSSNTGTAIYTYTLARLPFYALLLEIPVWLLVFWIADRWASLGRRY